MAEPIVANYAQEDGAWVVRVSGYGKKMTARAPGIVAARDRADQLVESLGPDAAGATVVHLLDGSAVEFTSVYMSARLARTEPEAEPQAEAKPEAEPQVAAEPEATAAPEAEQAAEKTEAAATAEESTAPKEPQPKPERIPRGKFTADIGDALMARKPAAEASAEATAAPKVTEPARPGS